MEKQDGRIEVGDQTTNFVTPIKSKLRKGKRATSTAKNKNRTPSGQILSTSVKDIRKFFSGKIVPFERECEREGEGENQPSMKINQAQLSQADQLTKGHSDYDASDSNESHKPYKWQEVKGSAKSFNTLNSYCEANNQLGKQKGKHAWRSGNRFAQLKGDQSSIDSESDFDFDENSEQLHCGVDYTKVPVMSQSGISGNAESNTNVIEDSASNASNSYSMIVEAIKEATQAADSSIMEDQQDPQVVDVRTVIKMFNNIQTKLDKTKSDSSEIAGLKKELLQYKRRSEVMTGVVDHLGEIIDGIEKKVNTIDFRSMKRHMIIQGLETDAKILKCIMQVQHFLEHVLDIEINIVDCFKLGAGSWKQKASRHSG